MSKALPRTPSLDRDHGSGLQLVIFDCDGVVVDSEPITNRVMAQMLAELGLRLSLEESVDRFIGKSMHQCTQIIADLLGHEPPADFRSRLVERTRRALSASLTPVPGIEDVLSSLRVPYCVASNGNRAKMAFTLGLTGLQTRFVGRMYCAEDVPNPKPAPDLFLYAAHRHDAEPSRCAVVEDTPTGIAAARAAGMTAYGFAAMTPGNRLASAGANAVFYRMSELPALLARHDGDA